MYLCRLALFMMESVTVNPEIVLPSTDLKSGTLNL